jgi:hypothetical protein
MLLHFYYCQQITSKKVTLQSWFLKTWKMVHFCQESVWHFAAKVHFCKKNPSGTINYFLCYRCISWPVFAPRRTNAQIARSLTQFDELPLQSLQHKKLFLVVHKSLEN